MILTTFSFALQSSNYTSNPNVVSPGGTKSSSTNFTNISSIGLQIGPIGHIGSTSTGYLALHGFLVAIAGAGDVIPPSISNVKYNGVTVVNNDFINKDALLTASVLDNTGISFDASAVIVDNVNTFFANFTQPSSFDAASGGLTFKLNLATGTHTIKILASDLNSNVATYVQTLEVSAGELAAISPLIYPNPFNPNKGPAKIVYKLNQDAAVTLYMFNEINQLVWKRNFEPKTNGGGTGYNEVVMDGVNDFGQVLVNGPYFLRIVANGKVIGKVKIAVIK
jgi:hypothetical protein